MIHAAEAKLTWQGASHMQPPNLLQEEDQHLPEGSQITDTLGQDADALGD